MPLQYEREGNIRYVTLWINSFDLRYESVAWLQLNTVYCYNKYLTLLTTGISTSYKSKVI